MPRPEVTLTIADELKRARAIAEIGTHLFLKIFTPFLLLHIITDNQQKQLKG